MRDSRIDNAAQCAALIAPYALDLWEELESLGFEPNEIQWHIDHAGERAERGHAFGAIQVTGSM